MAGERTVKVKFDGDAKGVKGAAEEGEKAVSGWSKAVDKATDAVATAVGIGLEKITEAIGEAVSQGLEQSQVTAKLNAQLGAVGADADKYGKAAGDLYSKGIVGSIDEAADAVKATLQSGLVPKDVGKDELDAVAGRVSNLAVVLDEDAGNVSKAISQMLKTGLAKNATEAFDLVNKGAQLGLNSSGDLLDTFNEYGTQFRKLGIEGPQALGLLSQGLKGGARDSDLVADALKEFSIRAVDGSKLTAQGFKDIGLNAADMQKRIAKGGASANDALDETLDYLSSVQDPAKKAAAATALFGTQAEDLGAALFDLDPSAATKSIGAVAGAADQAGKTLQDSAGARVAAFQRLLQEKLITTLSSLVGWISKNQELVKNIALVLGPIAAIILTIVAAVKVWTIVQTALDVVLNANPISIIVVAIGVLIGVIVYLATKTQFFQTIWAAVWGFIKTVGLAIGGFFAGPFTQFFVSMYQNFMIGLKQIGDFFVAIWNAIKSAAIAVGQWFAGPFAGFFVMLYKGLISGLRAVGDFFVSAWNGLVAVVKIAYDGYLAYINLIIGVIRKIIGAVADVASNVKTGFNSVVSFIAGLPGRIATAARGLFDGVRDAFRSAINWIIDKWNNLSFSLPSIDTPFGKIGGTTLSTPNIPHLATGGWMQPGKTYLTGEQGPELVSSAKPAYVSNAGDTSGMLGAGGTPVVQVFIGDREITDIVDVQIQQNNRALKRRVTAGAGAR